ncbi:MAG: hypothetical protein FWE21_05835 [Defluviitaleaceae bacterium]|nr:hypothetical protein [Defluviitaleaceae bacterium]
MRKFLLATIGFFALALTACGVDSGDDAGESYNDDVVVVQVSAAGHSNLAVKSDGTLWSWGGGFTGDGTNQVHKQPLMIMENVRYALAGHDVSFAITHDNQLWGWGSNWSGQIGDGTRDDRLLPVHIMDNVAYIAMPKLSNNSHVGLGVWHAYAIDTSGVLWGWGAGSGWHSPWPVALGDGYKEDRLRPVQILENVATVTPTRDGGYAVTRNGQHLRWGGEQLYPVPFVPAPSSYTVSLNGAYFKIDEKGGLWAWGRNRLPSHWRSSPLLGDGTTIDRDEPVLIMENITYITASGNNAYAIDRDGGLWTWGEGLLRNPPDHLWEYALDGGFEDGVRWLAHDDAGTGVRLSPVRILENVTTVVPTYYIFDHGWVVGPRTFAITNDGAIYAWGANTVWAHQWSLLGDGTSQFRPHPIGLAK